MENQRRVTRSKVKLDRIPTTEELLGLQLREAGISYTPQYLFHPRRQYRADFGIPYDTGLVGRPWLLVEINGNGMGGHPGAHRSLKGYEDDCEREVEAMLLGYVVLRVVPRHVFSMKAISWIKRLLDVRQHSPKTAEDDI